jgi:hypothetical protein
LGVANDEEKLDMGDEFADRDDAGVMFSHSEYQACVTEPMNRQFDMVSRGETYAESYTLTAPYRHSASAFESFKLNGGLGHVTRNDFRPSSRARDQCGQYFDDDDEVAFNTRHRGMVDMFRDYETKSREGDEFIRRSRDLLTDVLSRQPTPVAFSVQSSRAVSPVQPPILSAVNGVQSVGTRPRAPDKPVVLLSPKDFEKSSWGARAPATENSDRLRTVTAHRRGAADQPIRQIEATDYYLRPVSPRTNLTNPEVNTIAKLAAEKRDFEERAKRKQQEIDKEMARAERQKEEQIAQARSIEQKRIRTLVRPTEPIAEKMQRGDRHTFEQCPATPVGAGAQR